MFVLVLANYGCFVQMKGAEMSKCNKCNKCIHKIPIISVWSSGCELMECKYEPNNFESGRLEGISELAQAVKKFIYTYRYGNDDLIAFIEEYKKKESK